MKSLVALREIEGSNTEAYLGPYETYIIGQQNFLTIANH